MLKNKVRENHRRGTVIARWWHACRREFTTTVPLNQSHRFTSVLMCPVPGAGI